MPSLNSNLSYSPETLNSGQNRRFFEPCDLEILRMTLKNNRAHLLCWSYSPETPNLGQIRRFLEPCDLEIWRMTLENNRAPLLINIKLYASFHHHMWIQTGVTVRKQLSWVATSVTLTFDLWPWPFAWTLPWSLVITLENFMMIRWWEHSQKGVKDGRTDAPKSKGLSGQMYDYSHSRSSFSLKWLTT